MVNVNELTKEMIEALAFTETEKAMLVAARERTIVFSEECPETTPVRAMKFRRVNPPRNQMEKRA